MATIVYDGVGGGGSLFKDIKFYVMMRVPSRERWIQNIKANGGEMVALDKNADVVIADHAVKNAPAGSISWRWIEESVKKGVLQELEDWPAGPSEQKVREVGSALPARKGRVAFSAEDDRILMEWCIKAERRGESLKGNDIYMRLEVENNRHPAQSWRDRWIKYVSLRHRPQLPDDEEEDDEDHEELVQNTPRPKAAQSKRTVVRRAPTPEPIKSSPPPVIQLRKPTVPSQQRPKGKLPAPEVTPPRKSKFPLLLESAGGTVFTEEETDLLLATYDDIMNLDEAQVINAWIAWANQYENHTPQEWVNYFKEYIIPRKKAQVKPQKVSPEVKNPRSDIETRDSPKLAVSNLREIKDSQGSSGLTQSPAPPRLSEDPTMIDENVFREELIALAKEIPQEVDFNPTISGRRISLFRLWQVVQSDEFGGYDRVTGEQLWQDVAKKLDFFDATLEYAATDLQACYGEILVDFASAKEEDAEQEDTLTSSQEREMADNQLLQEANTHLSEASQEVEVEQDDEDEVHDHDLNSSPPLPAAHSLLGKRNFGSDRTSPNTSSNKRQHIDKGKGRELEIPATPEELLNGFEGRLSHKQSPSKYVSPPVQHPTSISDDEDSESLFVTPTKPSRPTPRAPILEPETQDFNFVLDSEAEAEPEEEYEQEHDDQDDLLSSPVRGELAPAPQVQIFSSVSPRSRSRSRSRSPPEHNSPEINSSNRTTKGSNHTQTTNNDSTQSETDSQIHRDLQELIEDYIERGYPQDTVIAALQATTFCQGPQLDIAVESLNNDDQIPQNVAGIWTSEDDKALEFVKDDKKFKKVVAKHGIARVKERKQYLRDQEE